MQWPSPGQKAKHARYRELRKAETGNIARDNILWFLLFADDFSLVDDVPSWEGSSGGKVLENVMRGYGIGQETLRIGLLPARCVGRSGHGVPVLYFSHFAHIHVFTLIGRQWDLGARTERELKLVEVITAAGSD